MGRADDFKVVVRSGGLADSGKWGRDELGGGGGGVGLRL